MGKLVLVLGKGVKVCFLFYGFLFFYIFWVFFLDKRLIFDVFGVVDFLLCVLDGW